MQVIRKLYYVSPLTEYNEYRFPHPMNLDAIGISDSRLMAFFLEIFCLVLMYLWYNM